MHDVVRALAITADVAHAHLERWCGAALEELASVADALGIESSGPAGGMFSPELFAQAAGSATAYLPVEAPPVRPVGRADWATIAGGDVLMAVHDLPYADLDRTYAALGTAASERGLATDAPIREIYLVGPDQTSDPLRYRIEVCWPIS